MINTVKSKSHLFLIELIIVILFFSFACVITINVFVRATTLAQNTTALNRAIMAVQSAAEIDKTKSLDELDPSTVFLNNEWHAAETSEAAIYTLETSIEIENRTAGAMALIEYTISSEKETIYQLKTKKYYPSDKLNLVQGAGEIDE